MLQNIVAQYNSLLGMYLKLMFSSEEEKKPEEVAEVVELEYGNIIGHLEDGESNKFLGTKQRGTANYKKCSGISGNTSCPVKPNFCYEYISSLDRY